ncbi:Ger(x)C family spore germination protein [Brevibacillus sp. AY1]|uniref:Ger(x)C family spore germination protein n=1 Tax=Brevibacillus sp. AY1 TaxID=2807621 RepID=UPI0024565F67|nr:Ger(x)C family spore germination protein [Brevibacillus sp. AY1]MDH4617675.1 Ger(x)C family spore germination protein [Brevibacillus sp. AY1]
MDKRWRFVCMLLIGICMLTGCWDRRELEERASVLAIAVDVDEENEKNYRMTVQIPIPIKIAGSSSRSSQGGGSNTDAVKIMSVTGRTITDATNNLQLRLNQRLFLGHTRVLAVSEEIAREGIEHIMDWFRREPQIRRLLWPIIVKGKAASLLEIKPELAQIPVVFIMDLIENGKKMGIIPDKTLGDYFNATSNKAMQPLLNYVEASRNEVKWKGIAIFRNHRMVGSLNPNHTWSLLQIRDKKRGGDVVVKLPGTEDDYVTFRPHFVDTNLEMRLHGAREDGIEAIYHCEVQGDIVEITKQGFHKGSPEKFIKDMEALIKREMEERANQMIEKVQKQYNSDIFKLGLKLRGHHYRDYWIKHDWNQDFKNFPIRVEYTIKLRRLGMEMQ